MGRSSLEPGCPYQKNHQEQLEQKKDPVTCFFEIIKNLFGISVPNDKFTNVRCWNDALNILRETLGVDNVDENIEISILDRFLTYPLLINIEFLSIPEGKNLTFKILFDNLISNIDHANILVEVSKIIRTIKYMLLPVTEIKSEITPERLLEIMQALQNTEHKSTNLERNEFITLPDVKNKSAELASAIVEYLESNENQQIDGNQHPWQLLDLNDRKKTLLNDLKKLVRKLCEHSRDPRKVYDILKEELNSAFNFRFEMWSPPRLFVFERNGQLIGRIVSQNEQNGLQLQDYIIRNRIFVKFEHPNGRHPDGIKIRLVAEEEVKEDSEDREILYRIFVVIVKVQKDGTETELVKYQSGVSPFRSLLLVLRHDSFDEHDSFYEIVVKGPCPFRHLVRGLQTQPPHHGHHTTITTTTTTTTES